MMKMLLVLGLISMIFNVLGEQENLRVVLQDQLLNGLGEEMNCAPMATPPPRVPTLMCCYTCDDGTDKVG